MRKIIPKEYGFAYMSLDGEMQKLIDEVMKREMCRTRPEALRLLLRQWKRSAVSENAEAGI